MKISENTNVAMPIKNMVGIIVAVAMGIFAYTEVTARLTSLETSRELFQADLLKKSEQKPTDQDKYAENYDKIFNSGKKKRLSKRERVLMDPLGASQKSDKKG